MKIKKINYERYHLKLKQPYTIAYETIGFSVNYILQIETDELFTGLGCASPDLEVTGETEEQVEFTIQNTIIPFLLGKNPLNYIRLLHELKPLLPHQSSALAMVDMALFDLFAKKSQVPLYKFLGGYRKNIHTSITIGILPLKETIEQIVDFRKNGFTIIKLKGGIDLAEDIEKVIRINELFPNLILRFDANQGYSLAEALSFFDQTKHVGIQIFEQPTKIEYSYKLGEITKNIAIPVMADESLKSLTDAFHLAKNGLIDMINIKLMKVGGILEAKHINSVAKSAQIEVMVGCLDECALGISAGLHFALSRPNVEYADLDGHLEFENDPFKDLFQLKKGVLRPNNQPGLGLASL